MHGGRHYTLPEFILWTRREIYVLAVLASIPTILHAVAGFTWLALPWVPVALVGTAAAFIAGFRNNATYARAWEARQIWGGIVNSSRTWGIMVRDYTRKNPNDSSSDAQYRLIYRHIAWLTALRFQLREPRKWETSRTDSANREYQQSHFNVPEWESKLEDELKAYLSESDLQYVLAKKNRATHILSLQSQHLGQLAEAGQLSELRQVEMENMLKELYEHQGRSERIKNYPYPRQFASINLFFIWLFILILPFGMLQEFAKLGAHGVWLTIPFSILVSWVFTSLEKVGKSTENPFEGSANDVPITTMSRTIEIDLREMLDEEELPPPIAPVNNISM